MTFSRTLTALQRGPVKFVINNDIVFVDVTVGNYPSVLVELSTTAADDSDSANAIRGATLSDGDRSVSVDIPELPQRAFRSVQSGRNTYYSDSDGDVNINIGGNNYGNISVGGNSYGAVDVSSENITARVFIPDGSSFTAHTVSGSANIGGDLNTVGFYSVSGSLRMRDCDVLRADTTSGSVKAGDADIAVVGTISGVISVNAVRNINAQTTSGKIVVGSLRSKGLHPATAELITVNSGIYVVADSDAEINARSTSGSIDVTMRGKGKVSARTVSGSITVSDPNRNYGPGLSINTSTVNGRRETPEPDNGRRR